MLHKDKSSLTMPEQESPFENSRRLANTPPLLFRWDPNYPTTFLAKMLLLNLCRNHSTSCYFQNWTISVLNSFRKEYFQWNKLWKLFWQRVRKHWQSDFQQGCVQVSQQVGLYMPFTVTGATWFKLFRLGVANEWSESRRRQLVNYIFIANCSSSLWLSHNGKNINPFESSPTLSVLQGQRVPFWVKEPFYLLSPFSSNYKDVVLRLYERVFLFYICVSTVHS